MQPQFIHLSVHSEYSLVDSVVRIKALVAAVATAGMPAVALTDRTNLFALVKFYRAAISAGIKPIVGVDLLLRNPEDSKKPYRILLYVQNDLGYRHLTRLISRAYREGQQLGQPLIEMDWLNDCDGLLAILPAIESDLGQYMLAGKNALAKTALDAWKKRFPGALYLGISRTGRPLEEDCLHHFVDLGESHQLPLVATNEVRFLLREDFDAHEVRVCIHEGRTLDDARRPRLYTEQQYLRSAEEMRELFADLPQALQNSVEIATRCNLQLTLGENFLPAFPVPAGMTTESYLADLARQGLEERLQRNLESTSAHYARERKVYDDRLAIELDVINQMGFPGYFLIVADFIRWAKENAIPVGPGRGSGAGSLVAYALKITDLDPLVHDLLFERFLNPERVSMPDFDIDFCMDNRDRVIDYVAQTYGRDSVSQIITYGSMAAKAVVRDVGRVLGHPYGFVDRVAKMVPFEVGMTLEKALQDNSELRASYDTDEEVRNLLDMALKLEGLSRNAGKHAGGVVIAPTVLTDFTALYCEAGGTNLVTQFDKDDIEAVGLVKFDFLGLRTLTIIDWALAHINTQRQADGLPGLQLDALPMNDAAAFRLLKTGKTTAVFQLESRGMQELIRKLEPDNFDEITALVALFRPGPLQSGMVDDFINRKHGRAPVVYPHPALETILRSTYGVILYQEQVMQIAQDLAGYTLGGADLLRRAMGKKKPEEMAKQREIFISGAVQRDVAEETAHYIFDLMEKFAGYGFNKSHSAAYALVSYQTLWLKTHYPSEFMAAALSADMDSTDKVKILVEECRGLGLEVLAPHVNRSGWRFSPQGEQQVLYGLGAIKGVGEAAIDDIVAIRKQKDFADLFDFCRRVDMRKANRRVLESLIRSGAMDGLGPNRATLMAQIPLALRMAEQQQAMQAAGQDDLFGVVEQPDASASVLDALPQHAEWRQAMRLQGEFDTLGLYLSGHPMDAYKTDLTALGVKRLDLVAALAPNKSTGKQGRGERLRLAGQVVAVNKRETQRGPMASVLLEDGQGRCDIAFFADLLERVQALLMPGKLLFIEATAAYDKYRDAVSLRADNALLLDEMRELSARQLALHVNARSQCWVSVGADAATFIEQLVALFQPYLGGQCQVSIQYQTDDYQGAMALGEQWAVRLHPDLLASLHHLLGEDAVSICYQESVDSAPRQSSV
jgi:DNA polymerase-3 subunit alpha